MKIENNTTYVFTTCISPLIESLKDDFQFETCLRLVKDLKQQQKIQNIKDHEYKIKALVNVLFTRLVLNLFMQEDPEKNFWEPIPFTYNQYGKPLVQLHGKELQFSSSSSNRILSVIVELSSSNTPVGIDLSHARQPGISADNFIAQFQPMFHPKELEYLTQFTDSSTAYYHFNHLWTLKEAYTKLLGSGLNIELSDFFFTFSGKLPEPNDSSTIKSQQLLYLIDRTWFKDITINVDRLKHKRNEFVLKLENQTDFYCFSTVLTGSNQKEDELPVILSFISQNPHLNIKSFDVNMELLTTI